MYWNRQIRGRDSTCIDKFRMDTHRACHYILFLESTKHIITTKSKEYLPPDNFPLDHFPASCQERRIRIGPQFFSATSAFRSALISSMLMVTPRRSYDTSAGLVSFSKFPASGISQPHIFRFALQPTLTALLPPPLIFRVVHALLTPAAYNILILFSIII
jgi:hypothetical protein